MRRRRGAHRRRRGDARPRRAREPVAVRAGARHARRAAHARRGPRRARLGHGLRRRAPRRASARGASCASSTPGTSSAWRSATSAPSRCSARSSRRRPSPRRGLPSRASAAWLPRPEGGPWAPLYCAAAMSKDVILTPEGLEKLKDELEDLQTVKRREVAERIKEAREFGDISENSEYDDAKNEQAMLEQRIAAARGEAALGPGHRGVRPLDRRGARRRHGQRQGRGHRRQREVTRSSGRPRPTRARRSCPTSRPSAAR